MTKFVANPTDFAADCARHEGECAVSRANFIFLDGGMEPAAVTSLHMMCGHVVIMPDASRPDGALLYHTSCQRMTDVVCSIFGGDLGAAQTVPGSVSEMTVGQLYRRALLASYPACKERVDAFDFPASDSTT